MIPFLHVRLVQCLLAMAVLWIANPQTLREAALTRNILVDTAVRPSLFSEAAYSATLGREFNMVQAEDVMKWWTVRHTAIAFDSREGDQVVQFALAHRMKVRGHCLVWDHNNPDWLAQIPTAARAHRDSHEAVRQPGFCMGCGERGLG